MRFGDFMRVLRLYGEPVVAALTTEAISEETVTTGAQFKKHLQERGIPFMTVKHARAFTASETAAEAQVSGHLLAKTVRAPPLALTQCQAGVHALMMVRCTTRACR